MAQGSGVQVAFVDSAEEKDYVALVRWEVDPDGPVRTYTSTE